MGTTKVTTREYDADGRLVREVVTEYDHTPYAPYTQPYQWWQPTPQRPLITCETVTTTSTIPNVVVTF